MILVGAVLLALFLFILIFHMDDYAYKIVSRLLYIIILVGTIFLCFRIGLPLLGGVVGLVLFVIGNFNTIRQIVSFIITRRNKSKGYNQEEEANDQNHYNNHSNHKMTVEEAIAILEVSPDATKEEIQESYTRLMIKNHPDHGGSSYIATQINLAKDLLLQHK